MTVPLQDIHPRRPPKAAPLLVTGLPRSGTSWVGKMLELSGDLVYVNEPMNPSHPPGRSPGILKADVDHYFQYICSDNEEAWIDPFHDMVRLRYHLGAELLRNHSGYDLARAVKYLLAFSMGRVRGRAALLDDPYALLSVRWLVERFQARAVVLVRDPVSLVGSWDALGWQVNPDELLSQPLLMRDYLEPMRAQIERASRSGDRLEAICVLWCAAYRAVDCALSGLPGVHVITYESLALDPVPAFAELYQKLGLTWSDAVAAKVSEATQSGHGSGRGFRWSLAGGLSKTAFRRTNSRDAVQRAQQRLSPSDRERVLSLTGDTRARYYPE